jgi:deoxyribose-phosphate aldolase
MEHGFKAVCVYPGQIAMVVCHLAGSSVLPVAVVGFPSGLESTAEKVREALDALHAGARELDMVINPLALQARDYRAVLQDIGAVVAAAAPFPVKVILETAALSEDQKLAGCVLAKAAGAAFVKTSTGFGPGGATVHDVALLREAVGPEMGVKASGGVRTYDQAMNMLRAGADRIGSSSSVAILSGASVKNPPAPADGY